MAASLAFVGRRRHRRRPALDPGRAPPDILIDGAGRLLAVRTEDGLLAVSSRKTARFNREVWLRRAGQEETPPLWPKDGEGGRRMACDTLGCIYRAKGHVVGLVRRAEALSEDCWSADVVVSVVPVRGPCPSARIVIDRFDLWREGGHAVWMEEACVSRVSTRHVANARGCCGEIELSAVSFQWSA